jgi:hypothetical protein
VVVQSVLKVPLEMEMKRLIGSIGLSMPDEDVTLNQ